MSGSDSGGGAGAPSGGWSGTGCEDLRLDRNLEAPVLGVADQLSIGDLLTVVLRDEDPPLVIATNSDGQEAGGILPTGQLIECLRQGVRFEAEVRGRTGGAVRVEVRAAP